MSDDLGAIFRAALGLRTSEMFKSERHSGAHDGAKGVQWQLARVHESGEHRVAVNLEGLLYAGERPIRKLLHRELARPRVLETLRALPADGPEIVVHMTRDAWINQRRRTPIEEWTIGLCSTASLCESVWREMLTEALACLGDGNERGLQRVTTLDGVSTLLPVVPHFNVGVCVALDVAAIRGQVERLRPLHSAIAERISAY